MEKQKWVRPQAIVQEFVANEYVAACGDSGKVYNFTCDAPKGTLYYYPNSDGKIDGVHDVNDKARELGSYRPCEAKHEASSTNDFYDGYVKNFWGKRTNVIVWRGKYGRNGHATTNLDMNSWEIVKS